MKIYIFTITNKQMEFEYKFVSSIKYYITNIILYIFTYYYVLCTVKIPSLQIANCQR